VPKTLFRKKRTKTNDWKKSAQKRFLEKSAQKRLWKKVLKNV